MATYIKSYNKFGIKHMKEVIALIVILAVVGMAVFLLVKYGKERSLQQEKADIQEKQQQRITERENAAVSEVTRQNLVIRKKQDELFTQIQHLRQEVSRVEEKLNKNK